MKEMFRTSTTPSIPPFPTSPDSSPEPAPEHPLVTPTTTPNSVSIEGSSAPNPDSPYPNYSPINSQLSPIMVTPSIPPLSPSPDSSPGPALENPSAIPTTTPNSVSIEGTNAPNPDSPYQNYSPIIPQLSPIMVTLSIPPLPPSPSPPVIPTTTPNPVSIEAGNTPYPDSPYPNYSPTIPQLSPIITPSIPLPPSPDSSPEPTPKHTPVIPSTTPTRNQSVSIERVNTPYPESPYSSFIPRLSPIVTPSIPPLPTGPDSSSEPTSKYPPVVPPVVPSGWSTPSWNQSVPSERSHTPYSYSPYSNDSPFIPQISPMVAPGVLFDTTTLPSQPELNRRGSSQDFTGYPQFPAAGPQHQRPMSASPHPGSLPSSPHYRHSVSSGHQGFNTPWVSNTTPLPFWAAPQGFSSAFGGYGPPPPLTGPPPNMMHPPNIPPPNMMNGQGHPGWPGISTDYQQYYNPPYPSPWGVQSSRFDQSPHSSKLPDHMDPFMEGKGYGAVLDPFLIRVLKVNVQLNPLITPLLEVGSDRVHLIWNMLFPTSMVQRSTDHSHISWFKGRDAPATFPRVSSLSIVSDTIPWVLKVEAKDNDIGVTCGEVIDSIGYELGKFSYKRDHNRLTPSLRSEVGESYYRNRSRDPGVPGGRLGQGMKRLDFLCQDTMFAGIEIDDQVVKRVCGEVLPCMFVLNCSKTLPLAKQEGGDKARLKMNQTVSRLRSRAKSQLNKLWYTLRVFPRQAP